MAQNEPREVPIDKVSIYKNDLTFIERVVTVKDPSSEHTFQVPSLSADVVLDTLTTAIENSTIRYLQLAYLRNVTTK